MNKIVDIAIKVVIVVLYLLVWHPSYAEESWFHYEAAVGVDYAAPPGNGLWYEQAFPYTFKLVSPGFEVGLTGPVTSWLDWHLDYVWLGTTSSDSLDAAVETCVSNCGPLARFSGHGNDQGLYFSLEPHTTWHGYRFGFEAGPLIFFPNWEETLYSPSGAVGPQVHNHRGPRLGFMAGLNVGRGHWRLGYQFFYTRVTTNQDPYPPLTGMVHMIVLKYVW